MLEIEKKILLDKNISLKDLDIERSCIIKQSYLKDEEDIEERIRLIELDSGDKTYTHTIKETIELIKGSNVVTRLEKERNITEEEYNELMSKSTKQVVKRRNFIRRPDETITELVVDEFGNFNILTELVIDEFDNFNILEIEMLVNNEKEQKEVLQDFSSKKGVSLLLPEEVNKLIKIGKDVSDDNRYKNKNLAIPCNIEKNHI